MICESVFHSPRIWRPYQMPCNIFCKGGFETLNMGSFRYPQPGWEEWSISSIWGFEATYIVTHQNFCGVQVPYYLLNTEILHWWIFCYRSYIPALSQWNPLHSSIPKECVQNPKVKWICRVADMWLEDNRAYESTTPLYLIYSQNLKPWFTHHNEKQTIVLSNQNNSNNSDSEFLTEHWQLQPWVNQCTAQLKQIQMTDNTQDLQTLNCLGFF